MSIGIAHMGPIVNLREEREAQKNGHHVRLCNRRIGSIEATEQTKPATTRLRRAFLRSPVLSKIRSLTTPPSVLPSTPARKTPAEKSAENRARASNRSRNLAEIEGGDRNHSTG